MKLAAARIRARALATGMVASVALAGTAEANTTPLGSTVISYTSESSYTCNRPAFTQPLRSFGDLRYYALAPSGSFTGAVSGWQLRNGAKLATDTVRGTSLALPPGASAISPGMCVDLDYPHFRFFNKFVAKDPAGGKILIEVTYPSLPGPEWTEVKEFDGKQGSSAGAGSWRLSPDVDLKPDFGGSVPGARYVALRFTALRTGYSGEWRVDDIWVDPRARH